MKTLDNPKRDQLLVAVNGPKDRWAGEHAVRLSRSLGTGLFVLRIVDIHRVLRSRIHYTRILAELDRETKSVVDRIGRLAREMGVACEKRSVQSDRPRRALLHAAEELRPTLVVVGARGTSAADRVWIGNACGNILKRAGCPVLVVGPENGG